MWINFLVSKRCSYVQLQENQGIIHMAVSFHHCQETHNLPNVSSDEKSLINVKIAKWKKAIFGISAAYIDN